MPHRLSRSCLIGMIVLAGWLACIVPSRAHAQSMKAPRVGQPAPEFTLPEVNGKTVSLAEFKGKKNVLLVFYRGWIGYW